MDIHRIEGFDEEWDEFVGESPGGTIFHTLRFLSYHGQGRFDFVNLAIRDGGRLVCVIPGAALKTESGKVYRSPAGASFGGFVFADDCDLEIMRDAVNLFGDRMRDMGFDSAEIGLLPICYSRSEHQGLHFVLTSAGYTLTLREATAVVPLEEFNDDELHPVLARNLRKAAKEGLSVRKGGDPAEFHRVLSVNLSAKGVEPTHTLEEVHRLLTLFPDKLLLLEAMLGDQVVGGSFLVVCNDRVGLSFYICDDPAERKRRVTETVLYRSLMEIKKIGCKYLDLGTVSRQGRPDWGLVRFKSKFGARTYVREHYSLSLKGGPR